MQLPVLKPGIRWNPHKLPFSPNVLSALDSLWFCLSPSSVLSVMCQPLFKLQKPAKSPDLFVSDILDGKLLHCPGRFDCAVLQLA